MDRKRLTGILLLSAFVITASSQKDCDPDCSGIEDMHLVADPYNCTQFYMCLHQEASNISYSCPEGTIFNTSQATCVDGESCVNYCQEGEGANCVLTCVGDNVINDPFDCNVYYQCVAGDPWPFNCPSGIPYFDVTNMGCTDDESVCCTPSCTPFCSAPNVAIPDPRDCTQFYYCMPDGQEIDYIHMQCSEGEYFDIAHGYCSQTAECQILCPGTTVGPITSTPLPTTTPLSTNTHLPTTTHLPITTSTMSPTTTTAEPATTSECIDSLTCEDEGSFPKCVTCHREYFYCEGIGQPGEEQFCPGTLLFNPDPAYPHCILPNNCPFHPSSTTAKSPTTTTPLPITTTTMIPTTITPLPTTTTTAHPTTTTPLRTTTTTMSPTTTAAAPTTTSECIDSLTCEDVGFFPKCVTCHQEYFYCEGIGQPGEEQLCPGTLLFNPDPAFPYCVLPNNCPYHP